MTHLKKKLSVTWWIRLFLLLEVSVAFGSVTIAIHQQESSQAKERVLLTQYNDDDILVSPTKVGQNMELEVDELLQLESSFGGRYELYALNRADVFTDNGVQEVWVLWTTLLSEGEAFVGESVQAIVTDGIQIGNVALKLEASELMIAQQRLMIGKNPFGAKQSVLFFNLLQGVPIERLVVMPYNAQLVRSIPFSNHTLIVRPDSTWQQIEVNEFLRKLQNMTGEAYQAMPFLATYRKIVTDNHVVTIYFSRIAWLLIVQLFFVFPMFALWHLNRSMRDIAIKRVFGAKFVPLVIDAIRPVLFPFVFGCLVGISFGSAVIFYASMMETLPVIPYYVTVQGIVIPLLIGIILSSIIVALAVRKIQRMSIHFALIEGSHS